MASVLAELLVKVTGDTSKANAALKTTTEKTAKLGQGAVKAESDVKKLFKQIQNAVTIGAVVQLGKQITQTGLAFNKGLANVASLLDDPLSSIDALKEGIKTLSIETGASLDDLTEGLYNTVSAFGETNESLLQLEQATKAAKAGVATVTDSINLASAVTKAYGDTSAEAQQKVFDLAFSTVKLGQTTFPELANSIQNVTDTSNRLGVSQEELFATFATLTGVTGNASIVSTQLRSALTSLDAPTARLQELYDKLGVSSGKAFVEQEGLQGALELIVKDAQASGVSLNDYLGRVEAVTLASALGSSQSETYSNKLNEIEQAAGSTEEAFRVQTETINEAGASLEKLTASVEVLQTQLFDLYSEDLQNVLQGLTFFVDIIGKVTDAVGDAEASLGPFGEALELLNPIRFVEGYNKLFFRAVDGFGQMSDEALAVAENVEAGKEELYQQNIQLNRFTAQAERQAEIEAETAGILAEQTEELESQVAIEQARIEGVIAGRLDATSARTEELAIIQRMAELELTTEREALESRISAEEEFQARLVQLGFDGLANAAGHLDTGDKQLLESIQTREELETQLSNSTIDKTEKTSKELIAMDRARAEAIAEIREQEVAEEEERQERIKQIVFAASSQIQGAWGAINQIQSNVGQAELNRLQEQVNAAEEGSAERLALEEDFESRKKELAIEDANRQKALATFGAIISTSQAIIGFLANPGGFAGVSLSVLAGITGALQIAAIQSQPIPAFAQGGVVPEIPGVQATGDKTLIAVDGGETVTPADESGGDLTVPVIIDGIGMIARVVVRDYINKGREPVSLSQGTRA